MAEKRAGAGPQPCRSAPSVGGLFRRTRRRAAGRRTPPSRPGRRCAPRRRKRNHRMNPNASGIRPDFTRRPMNAHNDAARSGKRGSHLSHRRSSSTTRDADLGFCVSSALRLMLPLLLLAPSGCGNATSPASKRTSLPRKVSGQRSLTASVQGAAADGASPTRIRFTDVTTASGVDFTVRNGEEAGMRAILESLGSGVALFDYDGDGDLDALIAGGGGFRRAENGRVIGIVGHPNGLFRNRGDGTFLRIEHDVGLGNGTTLPENWPYSHGVYAADWDEDGFRDVIITGYERVVCLRNMGDGTFLDVSRAAGLRDCPWSTAAAVADFNRDGIADVFIANYVDWSLENNPTCPGPRGVPDVCPPAEFNGLDDRLFLGNGDGTFRDASEEFRLAKGGKGLGAVAADLDLDGDVDLYVANDTTPNWLYINHNGEYFEESGLVSGTALSDTGQAEGSMGVDAADFDGDGWPDLWVANFESQFFALYRNDGHGLFRHRSSQAGITAVGAVYVGFGTVCYDFDLDGDVDIFATNGHVMYTPASTDVKQVPLLFENDGAGRFTNVAEAAGPYFRHKHWGRGVAAGDIDGDGDIDLVVTHTNEPVAVLRNDSPTGERRALNVRLAARTGSRDAVGTYVDAQPVGPRSARTARLRRFGKAGAGYLSCSSPWLHFAVPKGMDVTLVVHWATGTVQQVRVPADEAAVVVVEPAYSEAETRAHDRATSRRLARH
ncbi:MAG: CRTAC1 family protein [Planctomycetota bacterium]|nr:MAG: CRTAC1 family protein [Planctomycetota bacterium]